MKALFKTLTICALVCLSMPAFAANPLTHTLEKGETLYSISRKYKVSYEALAAANGITDPTKMRIGTVLIIPSVHVVAKGETLFGLSRQYGISVGDLLAANKLSEGYVLKIGDSLIVPGLQPPENASPPPLSIPSSTLAAPATTTTIRAAASTTTTLGVPAKTAAKPTPTTSIQAIATTTHAIPAMSSGSATTVAAAKPAGKTETPAPAYVPMPDPVKTQDRAVDMKLDWPVPGKAMYLDGKLEGIMIRVKPGETAKSVAAGTVVSAGPSRGFNQVAFIQAKSGYVYVYGGNEALSVKTGDQVVSGREIGKIGIDAKDGSPIAYFFVFRNGQPIDPALAPRD
ncbi:MAG TPA: LysM peptidoglycan-binding domain-containing protein [Rectinemataceae bacterium]|nr:LysM peptidoglycan-binding domain-containing protein [Rectinemataceae bacterium]